MLNKVIFILMFCVATVVANPFVDLYRIKGISAVEDEINKTLQDVNYWKKALIDEDLRFGYMSNFDYVLVSHKSDFNLEVFKKNGLKKYEKIFNSKILVGQASGDKQVEGDLKTPVGVYELVRKNTNVDAFYGPLALVTSYPNLFDMSLGKNGHGIWIHGVPETAQRDNFTQGCIAMENESLLKLDGLIDFQKSVLLINENEFTQTNVDDIASIFASIYTWQNSWKLNDLNTYLSFYDTNFLRIKQGGVKEDYNSFKRYKSAIFSRNERKQIVFSNINIIPYPNINKKKLFKIEMQQDYWAPSFQSSGTKTLYVELKNGKMSILTES
ncbi:MAG: L,D-transpeptidase family protein [Arcobacteraceae bacterium]